MYRFLIACAVGSAAVAGCSTSAELNSPFGAGNQADAAARQAAYAASSEYPSTQPSRDLRATALINRGDNTIKIINPSDEAIADARVWVNGAFVARVASIPSHGTVVLNRVQFYDSGGRTLADTKTSATKVELQAGKDFHELLGPVVE